MGKRVICLVCVGLLVLSALFSVRIRAESWEVPCQTLSVTGSPVLSKGIVKHAPNPLASAMLLVLAGVAICLLFDKKNKH